MGFINNMRKLGLKRPSIWNMLALSSYVLVMLSHVLAFSSNRWCQFFLNGRQVVVGLWTGCIIDQDNGDLHCSGEIFEEANFITGKNSNWHIGSRVLMSLTLAALLLLEFFIIAYACVDGLKSYRERLAGWIVGMSMAVG
ncbi:hypothetical protein ScPMuIL_001148 [Solemya velum]